MSLLWHSLITSLSKVLILTCAIISISGYIATNNLRRELEAVKSNQTALKNIVPRYYTILFEIDSTTLLYRDSLLYFYYDVYYNGKKCKKINNLLFQAYELKDSLEVNSNNSSKDSLETEYREVWFGDHERYRRIYAGGYTNTDILFSGEDTLKLSINRVLYSDSWFFYRHWVLDNNRIPKILINRIGKKSLLIEYEFPYYWYYF